MSLLDSLTDKLADKLIAITARAFDWFDKRYEESKQKEYEAARKRHLDLLEYRRWLHDENEYHRQEDLRKAWEQRILHSIPHPQYVTAAELCEQGLADGWLIKCPVCSGRPDDCFACRGRGYWSASYERKVLAAFENDTYTRPVA